MTHSRIQNDSAHSYSYPTGEGTDYVRFDNLVLRFLDLRHRTLAYSLVSSVSSEQHSGSSSNWAYDDIQHSKVHIQSNIISVDDYSQHYTGYFNTGEKYHAPGVPFGGSNGCPDLDDSGSFEQAFRTYLPRRSSGGGSQYSMVTDRSGNTFASFIYREVETGSQKVFNYLSNDQEKTNDSSTEFFPISPM